MLIVLEGLDGAGKSTQVRMFREYLESMSPNVRYIHFPRYDAPVYGGLISRFLRGDFGANGCVHPQLVALLFAEDRRTAAGSCSGPWGRRSGWTTWPSASPGGTGWTGMRPTTPSTRS